MSGLAAIFRGAGDKSQHSDKLLHLYWNRAELKKQFAGMRKEQYKLHDKLKQQEGAEARLNQKLDHLEQLLLDPESAASVVVFYQLRGIALHCEAKLSKFAEQLKQQREQKQHNSLLVKWNEERTRESRMVQREIVAMREKVKRVEERMQTERDRLLTMSGFLKLFRRRSVAAVLDNLAQQTDEAHRHEEALVQKLGEIKHRQPPENKGLDISSKRSINLMILSFAQQLLLLFADDELAAMAKEASEKSVGAINYGGRQECERLLTRIGQRRQAITESPCVAAVLQARANMIGKEALFRNDSDAVPVAGSVSTMFDIDDSGSVRKSDFNLLGDNYWGIARVFSR
ncbi:MAG: hypothetical protein WD448_02230 [Woeseia sp.]